jgi:hypothetical protein
MSMDIPKVDNAVEYVQRLRSKYGIPPESNGQTAAILDKEQLLLLLARMEQANEELRAQRDRYLFSLQAAMLDKLGDEPPPPPESQLQDMDELMRELEELARG